MSVFLIESLTSCRTIALWRYVFITVIKNCVNVHMAAEHCIKIDLKLELPLYGCMHPTMLQFASMYVKNVLLVLGLRRGGHNDICETRSEMKL